MLNPNACIFKQPFYEVNAQRNDLCTTNILLPIIVQTRQQLSIIVVKRGQSVQQKKERWPKDMPLESITNLSTNYDQFGLEVFCVFPS